MMRSALLHKTQDDWQQVSSAGQERAIASLLHRAPLYARAPTRIDLAGGWTDLIPFAMDDEGWVVNAAIDLHVYASLAPALDACVSLHAVDLKEFFYPGDVSTCLRGLNLPQAILSRVRPNRGCHLTTWSEVPKGSGLGASGTLGIVLVGLLSAFVEKKLSLCQIVDIAAGVEQETGIPCGKQDHYAGLLGGINLLRCNNEFVKSTPLGLTEDVLEELQESLLLVYTGESHFSGSILQNVIDTYKTGNRKTHDALKALRRIAGEMKQMFETSNFSDLGRLLDENWHFQKQLHPSVNTERIDELVDVGKKSGCNGGKACGAGGGGCLVFHCNTDHIDSARKAFKAVGARIIPFCFDFEGLRIWSPE
jgi:D-glycero-alpha-D-manno-heptose-7-phosphate kinase